MGKMKELSEKYEECFEIASREIQAELDETIAKFAEEGQQVDRQAYSLFIERKWILSRLKYLELNSLGASNGEETIKKSTSKEVSEKQQRGRSQRTSATASS